MENVQEGMQIYYRVQTGRKKASRYTTKYMYNAQEDKEIYYRFMDNVHKGKQIYYRVHGQCARVKQIYYIVHVQCVRRQADIIQSSWPMCTKASRSTTEFIDMRKARSSSGVSAERKKEQRQSSNNNSH
jgi:hypothetical protein